MACMISAYVKMSNAQKAVFDVGDLLNIELTRDNLPSF